MVRLEQALIRLATDLRALKLRWALVGGFAVSIRAEPRTTRDLDVSIAVSGDREAERAAVALRGRGYEYLPESVVEQTAVGRLATVRFVSPSDDTGPIVDLLFASSGIEPEIVEMADDLEVLPGFIIPVARTGHLLAVKVLAGREIDVADARSLLLVATSEDLELARQAMGLITSRGFDRGKNLERELARLQLPSEPTF